MNTIFILTMVFLSYGGTASSSAITVEYTSKEKCEAAKTLNREQVSGRVLLATCTAK